MSTAALCTTFLFLGVVIGVFVMCLLQINKQVAADTNRIDAMQAFGWHISNNADRWAVVRPINGVLTLLGKSHPSPREALDAAMGADHGHS